MKKFSAIVILVLISFSPSILLAQVKTIEIKIVGKQYVPPDRTPKIPKEFKDQGVRFLVRAGDKIRICNEDIFVAKPFSYSPANRFEGLSGPKGLQRGSCITLTVQNNLDKGTLFSLYDEMHARSKLILVVMPANYSEEAEENTPQDSRKFQDPKAKYPMNGKGEVYDDAKKDDTLSSWESVVGTWDWSFGKLHTTLESHGTVTFTKDGKMTWSGGSHGTWTQKGQTVTLTWEDKDADKDIMTLSADGHNLSGENKKAGLGVEGTRGMKK